MMGTRGDYSGDECDAFSRRSRRIVPWPPHGAKTIKQGWWRRSRAKEKIAARREARTAE